MKTRSLAVAALLFAVCGCQESLAFTPASAGELRSAIRQVDARGDYSAISPEEDAAGLGHRRDSSKETPPPALLRDADGDAHEVTSHSVLRVRTGSGAESQLGLGDLSFQCRTTKTCSLDDVDARWQLGVWKSVPDYGKIARWSAGVLFAGALVGGNVGCFAADKCSTEGKVVVGLVDSVVVISGLVVLGIALVGASLGD